MDMIVVLDCEVDIEFCVSLLMLIVGFVVFKVVKCIVVSVYEDVKL